MCQGVGDTRARRADCLDIAAVAVICGNGGCRSGCSRKEFQAKAGRFLLEAGIDQVSVAVVWFLLKTLVFEVMNSRDEGSYTVRVGVCGRDANGNRS